MESNIIKSLKTKYEEQFDASIDLGDEDWIARDYSSKQVWQFFCKSMIEVLEGLKIEHSFDSFGGDRNYDSTAKMVGHMDGYNMLMQKQNTKLDQLIAQLREEL